MIKIIMDSGGIGIRIKSGTVGIERTSKPFMQGDYTSYKTRSDGSNSSEWLALVKSLPIHFLEKKSTTLRVVSETPLMILRG